MKNKEWEYVSKSNLCPICKSDKKCSFNAKFIICRSESCSEGMLKLDKNGKEYHLCFNDNRVFQSEMVSKTTKSCLTPSEKDFIYRDLLNQLELTKEHREKLYARGFKDNEIELRYKSWPNNGNRKENIASNLIKTYGLSKCKEIPGFYSNNDKWSICVGSGIVILWLIIKNVMFINKRS